jgi:hypothetical protein
MIESPPAGWYPDPSGTPGQRYFDGTDWTESWSQPAANVGRRACRDSEPGARNGCGPWRARRFPFSKPPHGFRAACQPALPIALRSV